MRYTALGDLFHKIIPDMTHVEVIGEDSISPGYYFYALNFSFKYGVKNTGRKHE